MDSLLLSRNLSLGIYRDHKRTVRKKQTALYNLQLFDIKIKFGLNNPLVYLRIFYENNKYTNFRNHLTSFQFCIKFLSFNLLYKIYNYDGISINVIKNIKVKLTH